MSGGRCGPAVFEMCLAAVTVRPARGVAMSDFAIHRAGVLSMLKNFFSGARLPKRCRWVYVLPILLIAPGARAQQGLPFDDRGARYNPFEYVGTIETGEGAYTLEFRNEEESYFTNFLVTSEGVVAFDPLSDSAAVAYSEAIRERAPGKPLLAIVYSHLHTDHIAGARVLRHHFGEEVPIIAHERVLTFFQRRRPPFIDLPTETVTDAGKSYRFGDRTVELRYIGDAHTASILVAVVPELRMAYLCDFVNHGVVGWTDLPGIDIDEMLAMQRRSRELDVDTVTFCHGPPGTLEAVDAQIEYFETVLAAAVEALEAGLSEDQAAASITLPRYRDMLNYDDWFEGNVRAMYRWAKRKRSRRPF